MWKYFRRVLIGLSILLNIVCFGYSNQTFSARNYDFKRRGLPNITFLIDSLFWFDQNHCMHSWANWIVLKKSLEDKKTRRKESKMFYIYGNNNCSWCVKAKELSEIAGVNYKLKNVNTPHIMDELREKYPKVKTIPQIWKDDLHIGGYQEFEKFLEKEEKE